MGGFDAAETGGRGAEQIAKAASKQPCARGASLGVAKMEPATTRSPPLTEAERPRQREPADAAMVEFVRALARQQALQDHLRETGQDEIYDPRCDLRPL